MAGFHSTSKTYKIEIHPTTGSTEFSLAASNKKKLVTCEKKQPKKKRWQAELRNKYYTLLPP